MTAPSSSAFLHQLYSTVSLPWTPQTGTVDTNIYQHLTSRLSICQAELTGKTLRARPHFLLSYAIRRAAASRSSSLAMALGPPPMNISIQPAYVGENMRGQQPVQTMASDVPEYPEPSSSATCAERLQFLPGLDEETRSLFSRLDGATMFLLLKFLDRMFNAQPGAVCDCLGRPTTSNLLFRP